MPVEEMAKRGRETLRFGPMKPIGLRDPRTGKQPWAVAQLRRRTARGRMWNLVGFQTRLRIPRAAARVPHDPGAGRRRVPALRLDPPQLVRERAGGARAVPRAARRAATLFAGQITGVEGYTESTATGLLAGINLVAHARAATSPCVPPATTMLGALYRYLREADPRHFQPMNANFGLVDDLRRHARSAARRGRAKQAARRAALSPMARMSADAVGAAGPRRRERTPRSCAS